MFQQFIYICKSYSCIHLCLCSFILFVYSSLYLCNQFAYYLFLSTLLMNVVLFLLLNVTVGNFGLVA